MTTEDRLNKAIKLRETLSSDLQRMLGKKQAAEQSLLKVEQEIRDANLDPNTLQETLTKLQQALEQTLSEFEAQLNLVQDKMSLYTEK